MVELEKNKLETNVALVGLPPKSQVLQSSNSQQHALDETPLKS